jgi:glycerol-3-phosphate dehydrogenase (NAD(P)+)
MENISFIGCGSWGAALSKVLSDKDIQSTMWHRSKSIVDKMSSTRKHYLVPDLTFSEKVFFTNNLDSLIEESSILVLAIPSQSVRSVIEPKKHLISNDKILVNLAKGIEIDSLLTISGVLHDILGNDFNNIVALSGPSHAEEVIFGHPTTLVSASKNENSATIIQEIFSNNTLRTYKNHDILGVELGGAMKNVIAIAAGICDGIGYGDNSKAALLTRGMGEISKLGSAMGAESLTFQGLSGFGDLIVTCLSKHSRNRSVGQAIGEGRSLENVLGEMSMVAEGVLSAKSIHQLRLKHNVDMPIHEAIYNVIFEGKDPKKSVEELMTRTLTNELRSDR